MLALRALRQSSSSGFARLSATRRTGSVLARGAASPSFPPSKIWATQGVRAFSATARAFGSGSTDVGLSKRLETEIQFEKQAASELPAEPDFLKAFREQSVWTIADVPGQDEISITRKFGNETIRLMFSIADIQTEEEEEDYENPEESEGAEEEGIAYPIRVSVSVTKDNGAGALNIDMVTHEGNFMIDNISYYTDAKVGTELTAEADWKRRGLFIGPQFDTLDVGVQEEFEKFMHERGINESLALFIPEYAEYKEQKEYVRWLKNVKTFVDL